MVSEAQKRATEKYRAAAMVNINFFINKKTRPRMYAFLSSDAIENKQAYIRGLIVADMVARGLPTDGKDGEIEKGENENDEK